MSDHGTGRYTCLFSVVCDEPVWRLINPATLSGNFNLQLATRGIVVTGGPNNLSNSIVYTYRQYAHLSIDNVYEIDCQCWFETHGGFNDADVYDCFINAWNSNFNPDSPYSFSLGQTPNASEMRRIINASRIVMLAIPNYSQVSAQITQFNGNPPIATSDSLLDRALTSKILTSNQPNLVGRDPTTASLTGIIVGAYNAAAPIVGEVVQGAGNVASDVVSNVGDRAVQLARAGVTELNRSGLLPFSNSEVNAGITAIAVLGALGIATYAIGKINKL